jgi:hypothetical protein
VLIAIDVFPEFNCVAAWPEFLQSAGSQRAAAHLKAKLTRIQRTDSAPEPDRAEQLNNKAPFLWRYDSRLTGICDFRIQRVIRANGSPMHLNRFTGTAEVRITPVRRVQKAARPRAWLWVTVRLKCCI